MENTHIIVNEVLLRNVVRCITKALGEDINLFLQDNRLETNNNLFMHKGDYINENLRMLIVDDNIKLIPFKRFLWEGRILLDESEKVTYTLLSFSALKSVQKNKTRKWPHYLHSILNGENAGLEAFPKQLSLEEAGEFGPLEYDKTDLNKDYSEIMGKYLESAMNCRHYVVTYAAEHGQVQNVELLLLDKNLDVVEKLSLNQYIVPDFASLTTDIGGDDKVHEESTRSLVNVKPGFETKHRKEAKQA